MGQLGPDQAVSQGFDPVVAAHIPTSFPSAGLEAALWSNLLFLENTPDPVTTQTHWPRGAGARQQSAHA